MSFDLGQSCEKHEWDVVIVGTGMGGATLGYSLAKAGKRVLFCERGRATSADSAGNYPELYGGRYGAVLNAEERHVLIDAGRFEEELVDSSLPRVRRFIPFVGSGIGGSSALYGMALERFFPTDFAPRQNHPNATQASLEECWPVSYGELLPYYLAAEKLFRVRGDDDPLGQVRGFEAKLREPPPLTSGGAELWNHLTSKGLNPYRLPMACEFVPGCRGCQGYRCDKECKNDSARVCIAPAIEQFGATLLDECTVHAVPVERTRVTGVICTRRGQQLHLKASLVVLAAGALQTPRILFDSACADWPNGLANRSGLVGRNLMRHLIDLYLIRSEVSRTADFDNRIKEVGFSDFYCGDGMKLGSVQSFGRLPPAQMLFGSLQHDVRNSRLPFAAWLMPAVRPIAIPMLDRLVSGTTALATTLEDLPYSDNRVFRLPGSTGSVGINYRIRPEGMKRVLRLRQLTGEALAPKRWRRINQARNNERIAHVCGTCRFGSDPRTSCLDKNNRAHDLDNLYVVDSSFFPSSGGTNPSLTVAANALRVADHLTR